MNKKQLKELLMKEFYNEEQNTINLNGLDLGDVNLNLNGIKCKKMMLQGSKSDKIDLSYTNTEKIVLHNVKTKSIEITNSKIDKIKLLNSEIDVIDAENMQSSRLTVGYSSIDNASIEWSTLQGIDITECWTRYIGTFGGLVTPNVPHKIKEYEKNFIFDKNYSYFEYIHGLPYEDKKEAVEHYYGDDFMYYYNKMVYGDIKAVVAKRNERPLEINMVEIN